MQQALNDIIADKTTCYQCKKYVNRIILFGPHLIIDTSVFSHDTYINEQNINTHKYVLNEVSKLIVIDNIHYSIAGVVSYVNYASCNSGHYLAYTYVGTHWYKYDDMASKRSIATGEEKICPHLIIYVKH